MSLIERGMALLRHRSMSYRDVFLGHGRATDDVLHDLAKFCRAHESTFHTDQRVSDMLNGRREVFLRIAHNLNLSESQLWDLYGNKSIQSEPED